MMLNLRPVEKKDYEKILEWRNDPEVRINSLTQHMISIDEHIAYWTEFSETRENFAFIVTYGHEDIGVLKLNYVNKTAYEIDIFLSKNFRNKGLGPQILTMAKEIAVQKGIKRLIAKIKYNNEASKKAFEKGGFTPKIIFYEAEVE